MSFACIWLRVWSKGISKTIEKLKSLILGLCVGGWWVKRGILLLLVTILFQGISEALRISIGEVLRQDHIFRLHFLSSRSRGAYKDWLIFLISDFTLWVRRLFFTIMIHSLRSSDFYFWWRPFYFSAELKYQNKGTL